jgi:hypothetical protein
MGQPSLIIPLRVKKLIKKLIATKGESTNTNDSAPSSEGDADMIKRVSVRFALVFVLIVFFEELLELVLDIFELVLEIIHLFIELIEQLLEEILEHLLHTDHHETETIIANAVLIIGFIGLILFARYLPRFWLRIKRNIFSVWLNYKRQKYSCWRSLTSIQKIKLVSAYCLGISLILIWLTL